ncbi:hypothetical protein AAFM48_23940 [Burkholderia pseudomallei]
MSGGLEHADTVRFGYDTGVVPDTLPTLRHGTRLVEREAVLRHRRKRDRDTRAAHTASLTMDQPVDIINATIDELIARDVGLPAFWRWTG